VFKPLHCVKILDSLVWGKCGTISAFFSISASLGVRYGSSAKQKDAVEAGHAPLAPVLDRAGYR
jgi:hypothetical protein